MASAGSSLMKAVLVVLFVGVVFLALNFMLEEVPETEPAPTTPGTPSQTTTEPEVIEDPQVVEAREIGTRIGQRVGEEIGRRVGEALVAKLEAEGLPEAQAEPADSQDGMTTTASSEDEEAEAAPEAAAETMAEAEQDEEATQVAAMEAGQPEVEQPGMAEETQPASSEEEAEQAMMADKEPTTSDSGAQAEKPARKTTTLPEPPEVNRWWTESVKGNGLRIIYVGQSVTPEGKKGISVIFSAALAEGQDLGNLIEVTSTGEPANGGWRIAPHGKSIFYRVPGAGRYQMNFDPSLEDVNGNTLGIKVSGPVKIR